MGSICVPLLADLLLYLYEAEFIQILLNENKKSLTVGFNSTFRYMCIGNVLSINNSYFYCYIYSIYSSKLEIKNTTKSDHLFHF